MEMLSSLDAVLLTLTVFARAAAVAAAAAVGLAEFSTSGGATHDGSCPLFDSVSLLQHVGLPSLIAYLFLGPPHLGHVHL